MNTKIIKAKDLIVENLHNNKQILYNSLILYKNKSFAKE